MPAKGTSRLTPAQKTAVALGRAAGKTIPEIAKQVGIAPSTVSHLTSDRSAGIIDRIFAAEAPMFQRLMGSVVKSLEHDMSPEAKLTPEQRERVREQAVKVLQLGQPKQPEVQQASAVPGAVGGGVLLGDMLTVYRSMVAAAPAPSLQGAE